jgi:hypothetical protein
MYVTPSLRLSATILAAAILATLPTAAAAAIAVVVAQVGPSEAFGVEPSGLELIMKVDVQKMGLHLDPRIQSEGEEQHRNHRSTLRLQCDGFHLFGFH